MVYHKKDKEICLFKKIDNKVLVFNGVETINMTPKELKDVLMRPYDVDQILVPYLENIEDIEANYIKYMEGVEAVKEITKGRINMYRTGSIANTALNLFNYYSKDVVTEDITETEFNYLQSAGGGVRIGDPYQGEAYKYDIRSFYPSIMNSNIFQVALKEGEVVTIKQKEFEALKFAPYGVYHVKITSSDQKQFTQTKSNMYTHYEVNHAISLGLKMKVLGKHLQWRPCDRISGKKLFGGFVDYLYKLKGQHPFFKKILNCLWGLLVRSAQSYSIISSYENLDIGDSERIINACPRSDGLIDFRIINDSFKMFKHNYARMKPFLLGRGRVLMHKMVIKAGVDNVVYSHTDSMITKKRFKKHTVQNKIGSLKYEGYCNEFMLKNKSFKTGEFILNKDRKHNTS